jgi:hypothetical protein
VKRISGKVIFEKYQGSESESMILFTTDETLRITKGNPILDVIKQGGHHKVAFAIDQYGH